MACWAEGAKQRGWRQLLAELNLHLFVLHAGRSSIVDAKRWQRLRLSTGRGNASWRRR